MRLEITDNGKAFSLEQKEASDNANAQKRLGLLGIQERVRLVNGTFHIDAREGTGTVLRVDLPLPTEEPNTKR